MQIRKITQQDLFNTEVLSHDMVVELCLAIGMTQGAIDKLSKQPLNKASGTGRRGSAGVADLPDGKLRTMLGTKLQNANDLVSNFGQGASFEFEFKCLPDIAPEPDINAAGQNTTKRTTRAAGQPTTLTGAYVVVRKDGLKCTPESDPEKFALWQHVWNSGTFEQYFATAPKKAVTRTGRIITAASEMQWAIKSGWVKPAAQ